MVTVNYDDLSPAFDFVSSGAPFENRAFVSLETGQIHWVSELNPIDDEDLEVRARRAAMVHVWTDEEVDVALRSAGFEVVESATEVISPVTWIARMARRSEAA